LAIDSAPSGPEQLPEIEFKVTLPTPAEGIAPSAGAHPQRCRIVTRPLHG